MSERQAIEQKLRRKEAEIQGLEEKLKAARVYVQALRDVLQMLGSDEIPAKPTRSGEAALRAGSAVALARDVILKRRQPVHINDLLEAQGKDVTRESRASLTSSLSAYVRRGEIFTRSAPNTFGLLELGHPSSDEEADQEPPRDFGKVQAPPEPQPAKSLAEELDEDIPF